MYLWKRQDKQSAVFKATDEIFSVLIYTNAWKKHIFIEFCQCHVTLRLVVTSQTPIRTGITLLPHIRIHPFIAINIKNASFEKIFNMCGIVTDHE